MLVIEKRVWEVGTPVFGRTFGCIDVNVERIADLGEFHLVEDCDELGAFKAVLLEVNGVEIGIIRHTGSKEGFSGVFLSDNTQVEEAKNAINQLIYNTQSPVHGNDISFKEYSNLW